MPSTPTREFRPLRTRSSVLQQARQPFQCIVLALERDQDSIGGGETIQGQQPQGGWAVDHNEFVGLARHCKSQLEPSFSVLEGNHFDLGTHQVWTGCDEVKGFEFRGPGHLCEALLAQQNFVDLRARVYHAERARRVGLRVQVDEERGPPGQCEVGREVYRRRRFTDSALLIDDG